MIEQSEIIIVLKAKCRECDDWPDCDSCQVYNTARYLKGLRRKRGSEPKVMRPKKKGKKAPAPTQDTEKEPETPSAKRESDWEEKIDQAVALEKELGLVLEQCQEEQLVATGHIGMINMTSEQIEQYMDHLKLNVWK